MRRLRLLNAGIAALAEYEASRVTRTQRAFAAAKAAAAAAMEATQVSFSREERRPHVHVQHADGEAKFWIDPAVELFANYGLNQRQLAEARTLVEEHLHAIRAAWAKHFPA